MKVISIKDEIDGYSWERIIVGKKYYHNFLRKNRPPHNWIEEEKPHPESVLPNFTAKELSGKKAQKVIADFVKWRMNQ